MEFLPDTTITKEVSCFVNMAKTACLASVTVSIEDGGLMRPTRGKWRKREVAGPMSDALRHRER